MPSKATDQDFVVPSHRSAPARPRTRRPVQDPLAYRPRAARTRRPAPPSKRRGNRVRISPVTVWNRRFRTMRSVLVVVLLLEIVAIALTTPRLLVRRVQVNGSHFRTPAQIASLAGLMKPVNIFRAPLGPAADRITRLPEVQSVHISRHFPGTLEVQVHERKPVASVVTPSGTWAMDSGGFVYRKLAKPLADQPVLRIAAGAAANVGKALPLTALNATLACLRALPQMRLSHAVEMAVDGEGRAMLLDPNGMKILLGPVDDAPERLATVARLFQGSQGALLRQRALVINVATPHGEVWKPRPEYSTVRLNTSPGD